MTDQAEPDALAQAAHWRATLASQGIAAAPSVRRRYEDLLLEVLDMLRPFKDDGGYSGRAYALISKRVAAIADENRHIIGDHPLYDAANIDRRSS